MQEIIKKLDQRIAHWQRLSTYKTDFATQIEREARTKEAKEIKKLIEGHTCEWSLTDNEVNTWECNKCGAYWVFTEGGPVENNMQYCPECGRRITRVIE